MYLKNIFSLIFLNSYKKLFTAQMDDSSCFFAKKERVTYQKKKIEIVLYCIKIIPGFLSLFTGVDINVRFVLMAI